MIFLLSSRGRCANTGSGRQIGGNYYGREKYSRCATNTTEGNVALGRYQHYQGESERFYIYTKITQF